MRFYDIEKKKPKDGQWCLIREKNTTNKEVLLFGQPQQWCKMAGFGNHQFVVSWAPMPQHVSRDVKGWQSLYRGDDLPDTDCNCLVCFNDASPWTNPTLTFYVSKLGRFIGIGEREVLAWMPV